MAVMSKLPRHRVRRSRAADQTTQEPRVDPSAYLQQLLGVEDVAKLLGLKLSTVRAYAERGTLPCIRIGNRLRFLPSDVGLWIAERHSKGG